MHGVGETKVCSMCAETIRAEAKVCPHCRHWQRKWSLQNPVVSSSLVLVPLLSVWAGMTYVVGHLMSRGEDFALHSGELRVLASSLSFGKGKDGPKAFVIGTLTNTGARSWSDIEIETRFFDAAGKLIDAKSGRDFGTIQPRSEVAFRVDLGLAQGETNYTVHEARIRSAKDARAWP